jgi:nucleotide-binding universal stress UspA family protein
VRKAAQEKLEAVRSDVEARGVSVVTAEIPDAGDPVAAIRAAVDARGADLVVMGTHGHGGLHHVFLGSVAERTLRTVAPPVLAVKEEPERAFQSIEKILLAVDFSAHSDRAVEVTAALAARLGASVDVVHAFELPRDYMPYASEFGMELDRRMQADVAEKLEAVQERLNASQVPSTLHSRRGRPSAVIVQAAAEFHSQLIAMGSRGQTGLEHVVLGSVAERTLRMAPCSVLVVKAARAEGES